MGAGGHSGVAAYLRRHRLLYGDTLLLPGELPLTEAGQTPESSAESGQLLAFNRKIESCQNCALGASRNKFVFGVGDPHADLVLVGEAPGAEEDRLGEPFVGRSGKLLDTILGAIGMSRQSVYILNVLKCRPPDNRDPLPSEIAECEPYLQEQLRIIQPQLIVALGRVAAQTLLKVKDSLKDMRAQTYTYSGIEVRVTYHPAALLRNPNFKALAWEDFQAIRDRCLELAGGDPAA